MSVSVYSHLWVEYTSVCFNNADSLIEGLQSVGGPFSVSDNGREVQSQILGMEFRDEIVADAVGLAGCDFHIISCGR